ncbi:MAG: TRCF domain-containing protein, partial [Pseudomonadota bacterium]
ELYQSMLEDAVKALQSGGSEAEDVVDDWSPQINLGVAVLIPETYVQDLGVRLALYRRLADADTEHARETFAAELIDRFGPIPEETEQLLKVTGVKAQCKTLGIAKIDAGPKGTVLTFREDTAVDPGQLLQLVRSRPSHFRLRPDNKLVVTSAPASAEAKIASVDRILKELSDVALTAA